MRRGGGVGEIKRGHPPHSSTPPPGIETQESIQELKGMQRGGRECERPSRNYSPGTHTIFLTERAGGERKGIYEILTKTLAKTFQNREVFARFYGTKNI